MTIKEITNQLYDLSVAGYFNGEKFTKQRLYNQIKSLFRGTTRKIADHPVVVQQISLYDGCWFFYIIEYAKGEFDYFIPDTREQEKRVIGILN